MRHALLALPLALLLACSDGPTPPTDLSGTWTAHWPESADVIVLSQHGSLLTGTGTYYRFINPPSGTIVLTGTYGRPQLALTLKYDTGLTTHFAGAVLDAFHLVGIETFPGGQTDTLRFERL